MKLIAAVALVALLAGCATTLDPIMGRTLTGTPTTETQKLDCDLIFPPASVLP